MTFDDQDQLKPSSGPWQFSISAAPLSEIDLSIYLSILIIIGLRDDAEVIFFNFKIPNSSRQIKCIKIRKFKLLF